MPNLKLFFLRGTKHLKQLILILLFFWLVVTILVMFFRLLYPYQLEWMEGGEIEHILRLIEGKKLYSEPSLDFIPYIYTPFFYYIGFFISLFWEPNFISIRLISILSFLFSLLFIYKIVLNFTNDKFWSFLGVGLYVLSFSTTGFWFDIARVDTTANLFLIVSFYLLLKDNRISVIGSSIFAFLAFYTKQSYLMITIMLIISLFFQKQKKVWLFSTIFLSLVLISTIVETTVSNGWYVFWNFYFPSTHHWIWSRAITFWTIDVLPFYSIAIASMISYFLISIKGIDGLKKHHLLIFLFFGTFLTSYLSRLHYGGYLNVLISFVFSISITFPIALHFFDKLFSENENFKTVLFIFIFFQLFLLFYDPKYIIPTEKDRKDIEQVLKFAKNVDGDVYLMGYNYVQRKFGLKSYPHYVLLNDLFISRIPQKEKLLVEFEGALKNKEFKAIILDDDLHLELLDKYYRRTDTVFYHRVLNSKQSPIRRERVWVPK